MDSRGNSRNIPPAYDESIRQESGKKLASPPDESTREYFKLTAAIGEVEKKSDAETRSLLKFFLKRMAARPGDKRKGELQEAPIEARSVMTSRLDLSVKNEQATTELECSRALIRELPEIHAKLDMLMKNHQGLCETIEYKIGLKVENVDRMKSLENALIGIAGKVESLCTEVSNAEKRAKALIPNGVPNMDPGNLAPASFHGNCGGYADDFDGTQVISGPVGVPDLNLKLSIY